MEEDKRDMAEDEDSNEWIDKIIESGKTCLKGYLSISIKYFLCNKNLDGAAKLQNFDQFDPLAMNSILKCVNGSYNIQLLPQINFNKVHKLNFPCIIPIDHHARRLSISRNIPVFETNSSFTSHDSFSSFSNDKSKLKVLIVEDSISVQKVLSRWLRQNNCEVVCVENGQDGLNLLKTESFDLTLIDFLLVVFCLILLFYF
jgi:PleD family two-component response regulator